MKIAYVRPKRFAFPSPGPQVDVVAANVQGYRIAFASDEPNELLLDPGTDAVRAIAKERDYFVFREVRFDPQTLLPISVTEAGPDERLALDYSVVNGVWLLSHFSYDAVVHAKRHSNDKHYHIEATYGNFTFPAGPPQG